MAFAVSGRRRRGGFVGRSSGSCGRAPFLGHTLGFGARRGRLRGEGHGRDERRREGDSCRRADLQAGLPSPPHLNLLQLCLKPFGPRLRERRLHRGYKHGAEERSAAQRLFRRQPFAGPQFSALQGSVDARASRPFLALRAPSAVVDLCDAVPLSSGPPCSEDGVPTLGETFSDQQPARSACDRRSPARYGRWSRDANASSPNGVFRFAVRGERFEGRHSLTADGLGHRTLRTNARRAAASASCASITTR
jgi:hypothetical protein